MLQLLENGRKYSIEELSNILEVTPRMVRFYKEELDKAGIYIDTIRGPYGGYVLKQSIRIPYRRFNSKDIELLEGINNNKLNELVDKIKGINLEEEEVLKEEDLSKYNLFSRAIKEKRKVKILYYSYNKGDNERIIHPYNLFLYNNGWGVASFCETKKDLRHFELDRIKKYKLLDEKYE
jgi:predicted DNA-binding transcriptional regulator YafY